MCAFYALKRDSFTPDAWREYQSRGSSRTVWDTVHSSPLETSSCVSPSVQSPGTMCLLFAQFAGRHDTMSTCAIRLWRWRSKEEKQRIVKRLVLSFLLNLPTLVISRRTEDVGSRANVWLTSVMMGPGFHLGQNTNYPRDLRGFAQSFWANVGIVPLITRKLRHTSFPTKHPHNVLPFDSVSLWYWQHRYINHK
jgi:hypothetical protein